MKIDTIILDWSGVVSDDWQATFDTVNEILLECGRPKLSMRRFRELYELPWMGFYKKLGMKVEPKDEYARWERLFPKHSGKIRAFPFAKKALLWLKERNIKAIVLSSHNQKLLEKEIVDYGFTGLIGFVDGSNEDKREKINELLESHKAGRESTLYAGDMCHDIETARHAGIKSVAVLSGYDSKEKLEKANPDFIIKDLGELPNLIQKLESDSQ